MSGLAVVFVDQLAGIVVDILWRVLVVYGSIVSHTVSVLTPLSTLSRSSGPAVLNVEPWLVFDVRGTLLTLSEGNMIRVGEKVVISLLALGNGLVVDAPGLS